MGKVLRFVLILFVAPYKVVYSQRCDILQKIRKDVKSTSLRIFCSIV